MSTEGQLLRYVRGGRRGKGVLVDLNVPPPIENHEPVGGLTVPMAMFGQGAHLAAPLAQGGQGNPTMRVAQGGQGNPTMRVAQGGQGNPAMRVAQGGQGNPAMRVVQGGQGHPPPEVIDLEEIDDDVVIISPPRAFGETRNNSRRMRGGGLVVDVETEEGTTWTRPDQGNKRRRASSNQPLINCERPVNSERESGVVTISAPAPPPPPPPPPPPAPKEPTFSCPVCMGDLVEEVTTKCGHIFCKACIKTAIRAQPKCPTCRKKVTNRDIIRVYLPTAK